MSSVNAFNGNAPPVQTEVQREAPNINQQIVDESLKINDIMLEISFLLEQIKVRQEALREKSESIRSKRNDKIGKRPGADASPEERDEYNKKASDFEASDVAEEKAERDQMIAEINFLQMRVGQLVQQLERIKEKIASLQAELPGAKSRDDDRERQASEATRRIQELVARALGALDELHGENSELRQLDKARLDKFKRSALELSQLLATLDEGVSEDPILRRQERQECGTDEDTYEVKNRDPSNSNNGGGSLTLE